MSFTYSRTIRLSDTDAAGVVYFANVLTICHEAYEESLAKTGINLKSFVGNSETAVPVVHSSVDFFRPLFCGDQLLITLTPRQISLNEFEIYYHILANLSRQEQVAKAHTRHVCINPGSRKRINLPDTLVNWLKLF
ncbi:MAG: thioesterase family protein [Oscillatoria sp. PMC 1068.18]|nr:thioesterase family protein [Oscillatoria sp. PMC 1076.18]MEC4990392.1 thioesterase family protein [Oscillatoria sp. PMC 1068.18]